MLVKLGGGMAGGVEVAGLALHAVEECVGVAKLNASGDVTQRRRVR